MLIEIFTGSAPDSFNISYRNWSKSNSYPNGNTVYNTIIGIYNEYPIENRKSFNPFEQFQKDTVFQEVVIVKLLTMVSGIPSNVEINQYRDHLNNTVNYFLEKENNKKMIEYGIWAGLGLTAFGIYKFATKKSKRRK